MNTVLDQFALHSTPASCRAFGCGHINSTYHVECVDGQTYILQRINTRVFRDPESLMRNIRLVTDHLKQRAASRREVLTLIPTVNGDAYTVLNGEHWRMYEFVADSMCLERADTPELFWTCAKTFGEFINLLSDFDATLLCETIPHFHDTPQRFAALRAAIDADAVGRVRSAADAIDAALSFAPFSHTLTDLERAGRLSLRVTHNDTKINNVLFDAKTGRGLCVVDLDTVMPGLIANDFGDAIRFGASTAPEDAADLSTVSLDLALYEAYLNGFLATCGASLTDTEKETLPVGAKMMSVECGVRFLTDYLSGDTYFRIDDAEQNLRRARTQLRLAADMDAKWQTMQSMLHAAVEKNIGRSAAPQRRMPC